MSFTIINNQKEGTKVILILRFYIVGYFAITPFKRDISYMIQMDAFQQSISQLSDNESYSGNFVTSLYKVFLNHRWTPSLDLFVYMGNKDVRGKKRESIEQSLNTVVDIIFDLIFGCSYLHECFWHYFCFTLQRQIHMFASNAHHSVSRLCLRFGALPCIFLYMA